MNDGIDLPLLIVRARGGCQESLGELMSIYRNYLRLIASLQLNRQLQSKFSPSDIVQATFVQAQQGIGNFIGGTERELIAWLRKILASQIAMEVRRYQTQARNAKLELRIHQEVDQSSLLMTNMLVARTDSPSSDAAHREEAVLLADALAELPDHYREIIVARHFEGLRFDEIAGDRQQTIDSVKAMWRRGIGRLREIMVDGQSS